MIRLVLCLLSAIQLLFGGELALDVKARSAILINGETGAVLFEKHSHLPLYPASTTKIATALYVLENQIDLNQLATVSRESLKQIPPNRKEDCPPYWLDPEGTMMGLKLGEILSLDVLLHGLMMVSANDAANVIAENVGGTIPCFMEQVNQYLKEIGCQNTQFRAPHGFTHPEHWSTAYDLSVMTRRALQIPKFRKLVSTLEFQKPQTNKQPSSEIQVSNPLIKPGSRYYYPKAIGVKTGYTQAAGYTLVAAAEHEGRMLIAVLLGCDKKGDRYEEAKKLFEAAFSEEKRTREVIRSSNLFTKPLPGSKKPLRASAAKSISISFFPSEEPSCKALLYWHESRLPIRKGEKVGEISIVDERGVEIEKGDLIAIEEVKGNFFFLLRQKWLHFFRELNPFSQ